MRRKEKKRKGEGRDGREASEHPRGWYQPAKGSRVVILLWVGLSIPHWKVMVPLVAMVILEEIKCIRPVPTKASYNITARAK